MQAPIDSFPPISRELIELLDRMYPERCAELDWSERVIFRKAGQRDIVRVLQQVHEYQQNPPEQRQQGQQGDTDDDYVYLDPFSTDD